LCLTTVVARRIGDNEIAVIDIFVGGLTLLVSLYLAFGPGSNLANIEAAALTLLFTFTYLWVTINRYNGADGRGLGWFCLFVAITAVPVSVQTLLAAGSTWDIWFGLCWAAWARHPDRLAAGLPAPGRSHALMAEHEICPCTTTSAVIVGHSVK
jgi:AmiS/UreI family transporter